MVTSNYRSSVAVRRKCVRSFAFYRFTSAPSPPPSLASPPIASRYPPSSPQPTTHNTPPRRPQPPPPDAVTRASRPVFCMASTPPDTPDTPETQIPFSIDSSRPLSVTRHALHTLKSQSPTQSSLVRSHALALHCPPSSAASTLMRNIQQLFKGTLPRPTQSSQPTSPKQPPSSPGKALRPSSPKHESIPLTPAESSASVSRIVNLGGTKGGVKFLQLVRLRNPPAEGCRAMRAPSLSFSHLAFSLSLICPPPDPPPSSSRSATRRTPPTPAWCPSRPACRPAGPLCGLRTPSPAASCSSRTRSWRAARSRGCRWGSCAGRSRSRR